MKKLYWTSKDGTMFDVDDLTEDHMRNIIKMLIRKQQSIDSLMSEMGLSFRTWEDNKL